MSSQTVPSGTCVIAKGNDGRLQAVGLESDSVIIARSDKGMAFWNVAKSNPRDEVNRPGMRGDFERVAVDATLFHVVFGSVATKAATYTTIEIEKFLNRLNGKATILWYKDGCYERVSVSQGEITLSLLRDSGSLSPSQPVRHQGIRGEDGLLEGQRLLAPEADYVCTSFKMEDASYLEKVKKQTEWKTLTSYTKLGKEYFIHTDKTLNDDSPFGSIHTAMATLEEAGITSPDNLNFWVWKTTDFKKVAQAFPFDQKGNHTADILLGVLPTGIRKPEGVGKDSVKHDTMGTDALIVIHELGHIFHARSFFAKDWFSDKTLNNQLTLTDHSTKVSLFAQLNKKEFVAEVFLGNVIGHVYDYFVMEAYVQYHGPYFDVNDAECCPASLIVDFNGFHKSLKANHVWKVFAEDYVCHGIQHAGKKYSYYINVDEAHDAATEKMKLQAVRGAVQYVVGITNEPLPENLRFWVASYDVFCRAFMFTPEGNRIAEIVLGEQVLTGGSGRGISANPKSGDRVENMVTKVVIHEIGHVMHSLAFNAVEFFRGDLKFIKVPWATADEVSLYGAQNIKEFVAEVWLGRIIGRTYSSEIMKVYAEASGPHFS